MPRGVLLLLLLQMSLQLLRQWHPQQLLQSMTGRQVWLLMPDCLERLGMLEATPPLRMCEAVNAIVVIGALKSEDPQSVFSAMAAARLLPVPQLAAGAAAYPSAHPSAAGAHRIRCGLHRQRRW